MSLPKFLIVVEAEDDGYRDAIQWPIYLYSMEEVRKRILSLVLANKKIVSVNELKTKKLKKAA